MSTVKPVHQPLEGSVRVTPADMVVYTTTIHGAEYLAELIEGDCALHPAEQAWRDGASLREAVEIIRHRYQSQALGTGAGAVPDRRNRGR